jgi:hypothetical protein
LAFECAPTAIIDRSPIPGIMLLAGPERINLDSSSSLVFITIKPAAIGESVHRHKPTQHKSEGADWTRARLAIYEFIRAPNKTSMLHIRLKMSRTFITLLSLAQIAAVSCWTWPNPRMERLDTLRFDQQGVNVEALGIASGSCNNFIVSRHGNRTNVGDWLRTVRHMLAHRTVND